MDVRAAIILVPLLGSCVSIGASIAKDDPDRCIGQGAPIADTVIAASLLTTSIVLLATNPLLEEAGAYGPEGFNGPGLWALGSLVFVSAPYSVGTAFAWFRRLECVKPAPDKPQMTAVIEDELVMRARGHAR